jgi:hypothetical protein
MLKKQPPNDSSGKSVLFLEIDKLKTIIRRTYLLNADRADKHGRT